MSDVNRTDVTVKLTDIDRKIINEKVEISFYNQNASTLSQKFEVKFQGEPIVLPDIPATPMGFAKIVISPTNYRSKVLHKIISKDDSNIDEVFFVAPEKAKPKMLEFADIANKSYGDKLLRILKDSEINETVWNNLDKRNRATILNLSAKIRNLENIHNLTIFSRIEKIVTEQLIPKKRARIFVRVEKALVDEISNSFQVFNSAPGLAHSFFGTWNSFPNNSFKSRTDRMGNIQFTFATNNDNLFLADIDLDDHTGIEHVIDVIKHSLSKNDTDPFDIHQILKYFQGIDPEYLLL